MKVKMGWSLGDFFIGVLLYSYLEENRLPKVVNFYPLSCETESYFIKNNIDFILSIAYGMWRVLAT